MNCVKGKTLKTFLEQFVLKRGNEIDRHPSDKSGDGADTLGAEGSPKALYRKAIQDLIKAKDDASKGKAEKKSEQEKEDAQGIVNSVKAIQALTTAGAAAGGAAGGGPPAKGRVKKLDVLLQHSAEKGESKGKMMDALAGAISGLGSPGTQGSPEELAAQKKRKIAREDEVVRNLKAKTEALQSKTSLAKAKADAEADRAKTKKLEAETAAATAASEADREMILAKAKASAMEIEAEAKLQSVKAQVKMNEVLALLLTKMG